jgi:hypothetical protein
MSPSYSNATHKGERGLYIETRGRGRGKKVILLVIAVGVLAWVQSEMRAVL